MYNQHEEHIVVKEVQFIVDAMLGSLARWLRLLGYDSFYCETQPDDEILELAHERVLITRDKELIIRAQNRGLKVMNPGHGSIGTMLQRLERDIGIVFVADPDRSLCAKCNSTLARRTRRQVEEHVPPGSLRNHEIFWQCSNPTCQQVYWQGRHWTRIQKTLKKLNLKKSEE